MNIYEVLAAITIQGIQRGSRKCQGIKD